MVGAVLTCLPLASRPFALASLRTSVCRCALGALTVVFRRGLQRAAVEAGQPAGVPFGGGKDPGADEGARRTLLTAETYFEVLISMSMNSRPCSSTDSPTGVQVFLSTVNVFSSVPVVMSTCAA